MTMNADEIDKLHTSWRRSILPLSETRDLYRISRVRSANWSSQIDRSSRCEIYRACQTFLIISLWIPFTIYWVWERNGSQYLWCFVNCTNREKFNFVNFTIFLIWPRNWNRERKKSAPLLYLYDIFTDSIKM